MRHFLSSCKIEVQGSKNYFKSFSLQDAGAFGNNRKRTVKATPKTEKICIIYIHREYLLCLQSNASSNFLQKGINLVEQQLKFSNFDGNMIS